MALIRNILSWIATSDQGAPRYTANYAALERLFKTKQDVWGFEKDRYEAARFDKIIDVLKRIPHDSILEVGCAEGHLTRRLCEISKKVAAFDVSPTAVERARRLAPQARISTCELEQAGDGEKFDVVLCSETIYYLKDIPAAIKKLGSLGRYVLVTYTLYEKHRLDPYFSKIPAILNTKLDYFKFFDSGRFLNWRGTRIVLWWTGV